MSEFVPEGDGLHLCASVATYEKGHRALERMADFSGSRRDRFGIHYIEDGPPVLDWLL